MAIADATPSGGGVPLTVIFTGGNSTDDNAIVTYAWDFKDGSTSTTANPTHTFTEVGSYEATLTVTDADGLSNSDSVTITVNQESNAAPVAKVTASTLSGNVPLQVNLQVVILQTIIPLRAIPGILKMGVPPIMPILHIL